MSRSESLWGLRLLALAAALFVWFSVSFEKRERVSEKVIDAAVTYNPPRGIIILDPIQTVKVRLRGPDRQIRALAPHVVDVVVELTRNEVGTIEFQITGDKVLRPEGIDIISIQPNSIPLRLDRETRRVLRVTPRLVGEPAGGAVPLEPTARPDSVLVIGPESLIAGLTAVTTSPISLDGHALTFEQTVSVVPPNPLVHVVEPSVVSVLIPMQVPEADSGQREAP